MVNRHLSVATLGAALGLVSCSGEIGRDLGKENVAQGPVSHDSNASSGALPGKKPEGVNLLVGTSVIHRLTRTEYANTVRDLLGAGLVSLETLPADTGGDGFTKTSVSQASSANTLQAYEAASNELIDTVFSHPSLKARLVTCDLATGTPCIKSTLQAFLPTAWRRPVDAAEVDGLMALA